MKNFFILSILFVSTVSLQAQSIVEAGATVQKLASGLGFIEGPVWIPNQNKLIFSDIPRSKLMQWQQDGGMSVFREDSQKTNGNILDLQGHLVSCRHKTRDLIRYGSRGEVEVLADRFQGQRFHSPNDVAVKSDGSLWFTDPPWGLEGRKREVGGHWVYCRKPDGSVVVVSKDLAMPNGIVFSPDESKLYIADTGGYQLVQDPKLRYAQAKVHVYQVNQDHTLTNTSQALNANSDGMCVDTQGNIYTTTKKGIKVFSPSGQMLTLIATPEHAANACFGGTDYKTLFVTARTSLYSIRLNMTGSKPPKALW